MILETRNLTISTFSGKPIVDRLSLVLNKEDKIAVIGEEGNGKSTLLKVINNRVDVESYCNVSGEIIKNGLVIGYLEQTLNPDWNESDIYEYFVKESPDSEIDYEKVSNLNDVTRVLSKLRISPSILESNQLVGTLSGGEKVKIQIAKILQKNPDVLLLDEPTNDLDIETLEWLEEFILSQKIPVLFVSHDETLLEHTANVILHMEQIKSKNLARHTLRKTNFRTFIDDRERALAKQEQIHRSELRAYKKDKKIISHQKSAVRSAQIKIIDSTVRRTLNKKMRNILVRERQAENKRVTDKPEIEDPIYISFNSEVSIPNGKKVRDLHLNELRIGNKVLSNNVELLINGSEKVGIVGDNGSGKTTLLREIYEILHKREDLKVGYMPQNYSDILDGDMQVIDYLTQDLEEIDEEKVSSFIGRIKINWQEMNGKISDLSSGQKAKLMILKMMMDEDNVLILDEPTRNLSAISNPVIREILNSFGGTIISVSHDRKYLKEVCNKIYNLDKNGLKEVYNV